jgi:hypothetical protein
MAQTYINALRAYLTNVDISGTPDEDVAGTVVLLGGQTDINQIGLYRTDDNAYTRMTGLPETVFILVGRGDPLTWREGDGPYRLNASGLAGGW